MFKKSTKSALLLSVISLVICVSMLVGTTFAWFTDSVVSNNNIIKSGNLEIKLYYQNDEVTTWTEVGESTNIFKTGTLWEPGHTEVVKLKVENAGNLALKYQLGINVASETESENVNGQKFLLSDYIKYGVTTEAVTDRVSAVKAVEEGAQALKQGYTKSAELLAGEATDEKVFDEVTLVVYMPETVGNEANYKAGAPVPTINLGLNLVATQYTEEADSFGSNYDEFAQFPNEANLLAKITRLPEDQLTVNDYSNGGAPLVLDTGYGFEPTQTREEALESEYAGWHADFVVYADRDVAANSILLAGYYEAYCSLINHQWVSMTSPDPIEANTEIRLLMDGLAGTTINYEEICTYGNDGVGFLCGAADVDGQNKGTTLTVELRLYETLDPSETENNTANEETGKYIVIGTYDYTF